MTAKTEAEIPWKVYCPNCQMSFGASQHEVQNGACCPVCKQKILRKGSTVLFVAEDRCLCVKCGKSFGFPRNSGQTPECPQCEK